jgi:hypothetical protein
MNTQENNKLIAEFMGATPIMLGASKEYEMYGIIECIEDGEDEKHFFIDDELLFDQSWDWLMPVVERIEQVHEGVPQELIHLSLFSTRDEVYNAVVDFIKWYNEQNY